MTQWKVYRPWGKTYSTAHRLYDHLWRTEVTIRDAIYKALNTVADTLQMTVSNMTIIILPILENSSLD